PLGNDFIAMLKDSSLVSVLGVADITRIGKTYASSTFQFFETYNVVAFLYLVMTIALSLLVRYLEERMPQQRSCNVMRYASRFMIATFNQLTSSLHPQRARGFRLGPVVNVPGIGQRLGSPLTRADADHF